VQVIFGDVKANAKSETLADKTDVVKSAVTAEWNYKKNFYVTQLAFTTVTFQVWDKDTVSGNDFLGSAEVKLAGDTNFNGEVKLIGKDGKNVKNKKSDTDSTIVVGVRVHSTKLSAPELKQLQAVFAASDANKDGTLSVEEITTGLAGIGLWLDEKQMGALFTTADTDGSKSVDYKEFLGLLNSALAGEVEVGEKPAESEIKEGTVFKDSTKDKDVDSSSTATTQTKGDAKQ
jgi:Ca2+-binding EF-hand superfamily protein